jgi:hypothetical protein
LTDPDVSSDSFLQKSSSGATAFGFFLEHWNSHINMASGGVEFSWDDDEVFGWPILVSQSIASNR